MPQESQKILFYTAEKIKENEKMNTKPHGRKKQNELGTQKYSGENISGWKKKLEAEKC